MNANATRQRRHVERLAEQGKRRIGVVLQAREIERLDAIAQDRGISRQKLIQEAVAGALDGNCMTWRY
jgi:metal-responsive CopG/Arc/MetJ family transcriptional regulator